MAFAHLRRIAVSLIMLTGVAVLAIIIDAVAHPLYELGEDGGVQDGPFATVHALAGDVMWWIVAVLIVGIVIWILVGPIRQTRREEQQRRIR